MPTSKSALSAYLLSLLRIVAGFTFALHGYQKLFGMFGGMGGHGAKAATFSLLWFAGLIECVGSAFIVTGLFTRAVAIVLCVEMVIAYFRVHAPRGLWPIQNGGELAIVYCFLWLYFFAAGP